MSDLVRTLVLCGLLSGTQPFTIMGLLLVMSGARPKATGAAYLTGAFLVESGILLFSSIVIGNTVSGDSSPGRLFFGLRTLVGLLLVVAGLRLRRPPKKPAPAVPKSLERLQGLGPGKAFIGGAALADYQGPFIGSLALAAAPVQLGGRLAALCLYTLFATGIPLTVYIITIRSQKARERMNNSTDWVMSHRRQLASWLALVLGLFLMSDALFGLLTL